MSVKAILTEQARGGGSGGVALQYIEITTPPTKTSYLSGDPFDSTGMEVTGSYGLSENVIITTAVLTGYQVTPSTLTDGATEVTITYTEGGRSRSCTQAVTVAKKLVSIAVTTPPTKTNYEYGSTLDTSGIVVTATYTDGSTANVTSSCEFSPTALNTVTAVQAITASYSETGVNATDSFNVVVERKSIAAPTWISESAPTYDGTTKNVASSTYWNNWNTTYFTYSGCSDSEAGTHTATFTPTANYRWNDGSTSAIDVNWSISKASRNITLDPTSIALDASKQSDSVTISYPGDGTMSYSPASVDGLTITQTGNSITFTGDGSTPVSEEFTISVTEGTNYLATSATLDVSVVYWEFGAGNGEAADAAWFAGLKSYLTNNDPSSDWVGKTKSVTLTTSVLGTTTHLIRCIGVNQDGNNTVTFQTKNCLNEYTTWSSTAWSTSNYEAAKWTDANCNARKRCEDYMSAFPGKDSVKTVKKGWCSTTDQSRGQTSVTYLDLNCFLLSEREFGLDTYSPIKASASSTTNAECCYGYNAPYSFYTNNTSRIMGKGDSSSSGNDGYPWERSRYSGSNSTYRGIVCRVYNSGTAGSYAYSSSYGLAPAFVIGN